MLLDFLFVRFGAWKMFAHTYWKIYTTWLQGLASFKYWLLRQAVSCLNEKGKTWKFEWNLNIPPQHQTGKLAKRQNPLQTQMTFFNYWFFCVGKMVQVEELNQEFGSLHYIFFGPTGASTKMSSKVFTHWCFSNLMAVKPSLKTQLLTGSLNLTKILNG